MPVSDAHKKASKKWNSSRDNIMLRPTKDEGLIIRTLAHNSGMSIQKYILTAVLEKMERDGEGIILDI